MMETLIRRSAWIREIAHRELARRMDRDGIEHTLSLLGWGWLVDRVAAEQVTPVPRPIYSGKGVARRTITGISAVTGGACPVRTAAAAIRDWPGPVGLQIAENILSAWQHWDARTSRA